MTPELPKRFSEFACYLDGLQYDVDRYEQAVEGLKAGVSADLVHSGETSIAILKIPNDIALAFFETALSGARANLKQAQERAEQALKAMEGTGI